MRRGFFLGTLIDEAYGAVKEIIRLYSPDRGAGLAGFSMGANFCIRIARMASIGKSGLVRFISQPNGGTLRVHYEQPSGILVPAADAPGFHSLVQFNPVLAPALGTVKGFVGPVDKLFQS